MQWARKLEVTWLSCPSQIRIRQSCPLFASSRVEGSKICRIHCNPCILLVHPFELQANFHPASTFLGIQLFDSRSPLNIISGGIAVPFIETHSTIDIHS